MPNKLPLLAKIIGWVAGVLAILQLAGVIPTLLFATMGDPSLILIALVKLLGGGLLFLAAWKLLRMKKDAMNFFAAYTILIFSETALLQIIYQKGDAELLTEVVISAAITYYTYTLRSKLT